MKKLLFVICTHGDELAGLNLFLHYPYGKNEKVEWKVMVGNPMATLTNLRFTETDLNRSFNAKKARSYEEKRAEILKKIFANYDVVCDIHTTTAIRDSIGWDKCLFVNSVDQSTLSECRYVPSDYIIWDSDPTYQKQYLPAHAKIGITIEYTKTKNAAIDMKRIEKDFIQIINQKPISSQAEKKRLLCRADRGVTQDEKDKHNLFLKEFVPLTQEEKKKLKLHLEKEYYPVFINPRSIDPKYYCFLNEKM
ncbi:MAG: succinylglutamate desuccinylase/aspartoacylase family protein [bacterium]|nr:succinylglutamate desuccinylase/aspartoacylase family protein [bacterium]